MKKGSGIGGHLRRIGQFLAITVGAATLFTSCGDGGPSGGSDAGVGIGRTQEGLAAAEWPAETLVVTNSAHVDNQARVTGAITATKAASQTLSSNAELALGSDSITTGSVQADTLVLRERALVTGSATWNSLSNAGTIQGTSSPPLGLPVQLSLPAMPSVSPGTLNVTVNSSQQMTLGSGSYGTITLNSGNGAIKTKLTLSGGLYQLSTLNVMNDARVECAAACEIRVNGRASVGARSFLGPKSGVAGLGAANVIVAIKGANGSSGPNGTPPAVFFDNDAQMQAYLLATNGTAKFGDRAAILGKVVAKDAWLGQASNTEGRQVPLVTSGPDDLTVNVGQSATFTVTASGAGLSYQWQRDGVNISGANAADYTIASATLADDGKQFRVIVSNSAGSATSGSATLTVTNCGATDETCNGQDDDCNGTPDDGYVPVCVSGVSRMVCSSGEELEQPCAGGEVCDSGSCVPDGGGGAPGGTNIEFLIKLPNGVRRSEVTLSATGGEVELGDYARVLDGSGYGSVSSVGDFESTGVHTGDLAQVATLWTEGTATLDPGSDVHGDLFSKGLLKAFSATIHGAQHTNADLRPLEEIRWTVFFPDDTAGDQLLQPNEVRTLAPDAYGAVEVPTGARLELQSGTYRFESLSVIGTLHIDNAQSSTLLQIRDGFEFEGTLTRTVDRGNVFLAAAGSGTVSLKKAFNGVLAVPNASLTLERPLVGTHHGSFFAQSVHLKDHSTVQHEPWDPDEFCFQLHSVDCGGFCPCGGGGECTSDPQCAVAFECASFGSCTCVPSCAGKQCGDPATDGCGGTCADYCPGGGIGCTTNVECAGDNICLIGTCLPPSCATSACDPVLCGEACATCVPDCSTRTCGIDPRCGSPCGACTGGDVCQQGLCAAPPPPQDGIPQHPGTEPGASTVGTLPGQFAVSAAGRANYSLPVELPPGRGGVRPRLSLTYTGGSAPGLAGAGWSLGGLSTISRCNKTLAVDGWPGGITGLDEDEDAVCLDGERLILYAGAHLTDGARYRTNDESFLDVFFHGPSGEGYDSHWEVRAKDGTVSLYGTDKVWGMIIDQAIGSTIAWPLSERRNRAGVTIQYEYSCQRLFNPTGRACDGEPLIRTILYGAHAASDLWHTHKVAFEYEPRRQAYYGVSGAGWARRVLEYRLSSISVGAGDHALRRYRLTYRELNDQRGDFLEEVSECAEELGEELCLAPTRFDYVQSRTPESGHFDRDFQPPQDQVHTLPSTFGGGPVDKSQADIEAQGTAKPTLTLDWNGDGKLDFLHPDLDNEWALSLGVMDDTALFEGPYPFVSDTGNSPRCVIPTSIADFDGDGRSDVLSACPVGEGPGRFQLYLSRDDLTQPFLTYTFDTVGQVLHDTAIAIDVNADGLSEIITCTPTLLFPPNQSAQNPKTLLWSNTGGFGAPTTIQQVAEVARASSHWCPARKSPLPDVRQTPRFVDFDGDGTPNVSHYGEYLKFGPGFQSEWHDIGFEEVPDEAPVSRHLDVNGDRLQDVLVATPWDYAGGDVQDYKSRYTIWVNQGRRDATPIPAFLPRVELGEMEVTAPGDYMASGISYRLFERLRIIDYDRDGLDELLGFVGNEWYVFSNVDPGDRNPTQIVYRATKIAPAGRGHHLGTEQRFLSDGMAPLVADFDGDAVQDVLLFSPDDSTMRLVRGDRPERHLLSRVTDGLGNELQITYSGSAYTPGVDCGPHARCLQNPGPLVGKITSFDSAGRVDGSTEFTYSDARFGYHGQGALGFGSRTMLERDGTGEAIRSVVEEYDNGVTFDETTSRFLFAGRLLRSTTQTAAVESGFSENGIGVYLTAFQTFVEHEYDVLLSDVGRPFVVPVLTVTVQSQWIDGVSLDLYTTIVRRPKEHFDQFGNQRVQETIALDGYGNEVERTMVSNVFFPRGTRNREVAGDSSRWEVGLLSARSVTSRGKTRGLNFDYDDETGLLWKRVRSPADPTFEQRTEFLHDEVGNVVQVRTEAGGAIKDAALQYDASKLRLTSVTGPTGLESLVQIDAATGLLLTEVDPNASAVQHVYDVFGREVKTVSPTGVTSTRVETSEGSLGEAYAILRTQTDPRASTQSVAVMDSKGRLLRSESTGLAGVTVEQRRTYNVQGLPESVEVPHPLGEPATAVTTYTYDRLGSRRSIAAPAEGGGAPSVTLFEYATRYTANLGLFPEPEPGQPLVTFLARKIDPDQQDTFTLSGPLQEALVRVQGLGEGREETRMTYDAFGDIAQFLGANNLLTIARDDWGRVTSVSDSDIGTLSYEYDPFDRLVHATDADGTETSYEYDVLDRLVRVVHDAEEEQFIFDRDLEGEAEGEPVAENALGRLVRSTRTTQAGTFHQRFRYESPPTGGNPLENRALLESVTLETPGASFETRYEYYSGTARVDVQHYPEAAGADAFAVRYCYDDQGALTHVFDAFGSATCENPSAPDASAYWTRTSTFRGLGVDGVELGNGVSIDAELDPNTFRLTAHSIAGAGNTIGFAYAYEPGGRLAQETRTGTGGASDVSFDKAYDYSAGGLLAGISDASSGDPLYDPTYNPEKQLEAGPTNLGTFVYDGADGSPFGNRLTRVDPPPSDPEQAPHVFEYDGRGNQNVRQGPRIPGGEQSISYNVFNLPDTITTGTGSGAVTVAFDYDASGARVHTLRPGAEAWHFGGIYEKELRENDLDIEEEHRYSVFAQGQRIAQVARARAPGSTDFVETATYFHYDRLGSVIALSDAAGTITHELDYDVYGEPKQAMPTAFGYTGHRHEQDLGLVDAGGRFYDPVFGVFLSADPISPLGGSSPRLNRYAYVGYDPVNFVDPTGFFFEEAWNGVVWFHEQLIGHTITAPTNLIFTGRYWDTTWDTDTTEALITAVAATAAGIACGVASAGNPVVAGMCAGAVAGALGSVFAGARTFDEIAPSVIFSTVAGGFGGAAGMFANTAVYSTTGSHLAGSFAAAGATTGMTVGVQLVQGGDINWAQVAANAAVSGLRAWYDGAQEDAAARAQEVGQAAGARAGRASDTAAGFARTARENYDRRGFRGGVASGRPQLVGFVTDPDGRVLGQLDLLRYETAYRGVKIEMGYRDYGTGAQDLQVVQTVNADPVAYPGWTTNPSVDGDLTGFYPATHQNAGGYDLVFRDAPARYTTPGPVTWQAETSVVGRFDIHYQRLISVQWGWGIPHTNGPVVLNPVVLIETPSDFHVGAIP